MVSVNGGAAVAATLVASDWTFNLTGLTANAANTIAVTATDVALPSGNTNTVNESIIVDTLPPAVTLTSPANNILTGLTSPLLTFTATDTNLAATSIMVDGVTVNAAPVSPVTIAPLADGLHRLQLTAVDSAANSSFKLITLTVDTIVSPFTLTAPAATHLKALALSGTVEAGSTVTVAVGTGAAAAATVTGTTWTFNVAGLVDGDNNITVTATDAPLGNTATKQAVIKVVPSDGKITGAATVGIADALKALQFSTGLVQATAVEAVHADVAPLVNGLPTPNGKVDIGDVVLILRKVVDPTSW
jgi:hypothetical protein